ncbi:hypothetical protein K435DRAFT_870657 [Dendrothele bispora CBS 962.96]|uniref:Reverse transcriptase RNase H-like domain-containing protein n=1 Tax=Dendrothele bispora (strain CBS 962.96) TaxID=1314807 RepID=A0A4S8L627_DENBC|nr:hypothetical protein K435DRAFT_870657 [Dendrothele bispora CBS 962.96]
MSMEAVEAFEVLKHRIMTVSVLIKVDYEVAVKVTKVRESDEGPVVVGADASWIGAGWVVYQVHDKLKHPAIFGSCTFNKTEQNYGQLKTELLDHHAKSLPKMLKELDDVPNTPILHWISWIKLFNFESHHVPTESHKAEDGLLRRPKAPHEVEETVEEQEKFLEGFINEVYGDSVPISREVGFSDAARYLFNALFAKYSSLYDTSWARTYSIPFSHCSRSIVYSSVDSLPSNSFVMCMALRNVDTTAVQPTADFLLRSFPTEREVECLLGDEVVTLGITEYFSFSQKRVIDVDMQHQPLDEDGEDTLWIELQKYFSTGDVPPHCETDRERLRFREMASKYFLHGGQLWFAPKKKSRNLPRLVVESIKCLNFGMQQDTKNKVLSVLEPNQQKPQSKVQVCACPNLVQASSASGT